MAVDLARLASNVLQKKLTALSELDSSVVFQFPVEFQIVKETAAVDRLLDAPGQMETFKTKFATLNEQLADVSIIEWAMQLVNRVMSRAIQLEPGLVAGMSEALGALAQLVPTLLMRSRRQPEPEILRGVTRVVAAFRAKCLEVSMKETVDASVSVLEETVEVKRGMDDAVAKGGLLFEGLERAVKKVRGGLEEEEEEEEKEVKESKGPKDEDEEDEEVDEPPVKRRRVENEKSKGKEEAEEELVMPEASSVKIFDSISFSSYCESLWAPHQSFIRTLRTLHRTMRRLLISVENQILPGPTPPNLKTAFYAAQDQLAAFWLI
eukprot:GABV01008703.1.p1 GENE.GABV01008703.1~~GABV01008703.1.p1  ORF type:complete len:346 (-),score=155.05 GABV01008703.1:100-1065(-)